MPKGLSVRVVADWNAPWSTCGVIDHRARAGPIGPLRRSLECVKTLCQTFRVRLINASSRQVQVPEMQALERLLTAVHTCARSPTCPLGTDHQQATATFQQIVRPLIDQPITTADGRQVTYTAVIDGVATGLCGEVGWRAFILALTELKAGSGKTTLFLRDILSQRSADGSYGNGNESLLAINCLDEERHTPEQETSMTRDIFRVAPFIDTGRSVKARDLCEHWPVRPTVGYPQRPEHQRPAQNHGRIGHT